MGADSVLVNAAFKEAISRGKANSINKKPLYDSINANMNKAFNTLNSIIDRYAVKKEANRAGVRKQMSGFQKTADELTQGMYAAKEPLPDAFINAFRDKIISLQEEFEDYNTYGKGDTSENNMARSRIMGELTRVKNQAINFRADSRIFLDRLKDVPPESVYGPNIPANQQALDFNNYKRLVEEGKIEVVYGEKGIEITSRGYNTRTIKVPLTNPSEQFLEAGSDNMMDAEESYGKDVVVTIGSLKSNFKATDLAHHSDIVKDINDYTKVGEDDAGKQNPQKSYDEEEAKEIFTRHVSTEEKFNNVVTSKIDGIHEIRSSFRVSLENNLNIPISVLQNMTYDADGDGVDDMDSLIAELDIDGGPNGEGDGIIDEKDIAAGENLANFEQNLDSLIDALTNVKHPAFDIGISAPMLGAYLEKINKGRYNTIYDRTVKANSRNNPKGATGSQIIYGNQNLGEKSFVVQDDILDKAMNNEPIISWGGERFDPDPKNPGNYILEGTEESKPIDGILRGKYFGMNERINSRKLEYPTGLPNVNTVAPASSVETPNVEDFGRNANVNNVLSGWEKRYEGMGFTYSKNKPGINQKYTSVTITAKNGATHVTELGRTLGKGKEAQAKAFNKFIEENKI
tara:strand:- start:40 stop:1926 length:1887 start_codon:yes stop_codon:yes gene_type:complete